jgi:hypothetical protein
MGRGIFNIVIGAVFIVGGLTGKLVFIGTSSGALLAVIGLGLCGLGAWSIVKSRRAPPTA